MDGHECPVRRTADRGQAYTVEGVLAATIVLTAVLFSLQAVAVTPTASGPDTSLSQKRALAHDALLLVEEEDDSSWSEIVRYWVPQTSDNTIAGFRTAVFTDTSLGAILDRTLVDRELQYNLYIAYYENRDAESVERQYLRQSGTPDETAVTASYPVTLYDDSPLLDENGQEIDSSLTVKERPRNADAAPFYVTEDMERDQRVFAVVEVRLVVW
jgi:hypothetical protein